MPGRVMRGGGNRTHYALTPTQVLLAPFTNCILHSASYLSWSAVTPVFAYQDHRLALHPDRVERSSTLPVEGDEGGTPIIERNIKALPISCCRHTYSFMVGSTALEAAVTFGPQSRRGSSSSTIRCFYLAFIIPQCRHRCQAILQTFSKLILNDLRQVFL